MTTSDDAATARESGDWLRIDPQTVDVFDRGGGVTTIPYVGIWNTGRASFTTGVTRFSVGTGLPLHSHNVEESVFVVSGLATVVVGDTSVDLVAGEATWVPAGVPHRFVNRGDSPMEIYWVYGGLHVTRTITATGETFEHLSPSDLGGSRV